MDARLITFETDTRGELETQVNNFLNDNVGSILGMALETTTMLDMRWDEPVSDDNTKNYGNKILYSCYLVYYPKGLKKDG